MNVSRLTARPLSGAWLFPLIAVNGAGEFGSDRPLTGLSVGLITLVCGASGAMWQWMNRRDVTDRLTILAVWFLCAVAFAAAMSVSGDGEVTSSASAAFGLAAVLAGLVLCEQWQRGRDSRRADRPTLVSDAPTA